MEIDLDVRLCWVQLSLLDLLLVDSKALDLVLLDGYREVGCAISWRGSAIHRSKGLLDLREGDALRQRNALLDSLRPTCHDIKTSMIEFLGNFGWDGDEVV